MKIGLVTFLCFALVAVATLSPVARWIARWMTTAGSLTYPLYLVHENVGWFVIHRTRGALGPWGAVLAASVVVLVGATLLYRLVEKPFGGRLRTATLAMLRPVERRPEVPAPALPPRHETTSRPPRTHGPSRHTGPITAAVPVSRRPEIATTGGGTHRGY